MQDPNGPPDAERRGAPRPVVETLFRRFQAAYGSQKLVAMFDGMSGAPAAVMREVMLVWSAKLRPYHDDVIARAMSDLLDTGNPWPPTLAEFTRACIETNERLHRNAAGERADRALPAPSQIASKDSPVVQEAMAEMRKFLRAHVV